MNTMDMLASDFNCTSNFIPNEKKLNKVINFEPDENATSSTGEKSMHSGKKRSTLKFDSSPDEFQDYLAKRFPELEKSSNTNEDNLKLLPREEPSEIIANSKDIFSAKGIKNNEIQLNNLSNNNNHNILMNPRIPIIRDNHVLANLDESQTKLKTSKNIFDMKEWIKKIHTFIYLDDLRCYDEALGYYRNLTKDDLGKMIYNTFDYDIVRQLNPYSDISAIYKALCLDPKIQNLTFINNQFCINCINGVVYITNKSGSTNISFSRHDRQYGFLNCINASFIDCNSLENTQFGLFLISITNGDVQLMNLVREILGYIFSNLNNAKKFFIFYGKSNSGKSVLLNLITHLIGEENVSNIEIEKLSDPKYAAQLNGKLLNVCSELPDKGISDTGIIKALVSENDKVSARQLYSNPFSFYNKAKLLFATNNLPEIRSASYKDNSAFFNRIILVPFLNSIPDEKQDKYLLEKLLLEKDIIFSWAIGGLLSYINNGYMFSYSAIANMYLDDYKKNCNNYITFINSKCELCQDKYVFMDELFIAYGNYCDENLLDKPTAKDKKYLRQLVSDTLNISYTKIHRGGFNKKGFYGIRLVDC